MLSVQGDVSDDEMLRRAGIERAATLVAALDTDADNLYVTVAGKSMRPDLQIIARARNESSEPKLVRAGADRVVNPQQLGGDRMASFVTQPHVVDFVDVVMHDGTLEFRLEELTVSPASPLAGSTLRSAQLRDRTGALVLAIRRPDGELPHQPVARGRHRGGRRADQRGHGRTARHAGPVRGTPLRRCAHPDLDDAGPPTPLSGTPDRGGLRTRRAKARPVQSRTWPAPGSRPCLARRPARSTASHRDAGAGRRQRRSAARGRDRPRRRRVRPAVRSAGRQGAGDVALRWGHRAPPP